MFESLKAYFNDRAQAARVTVPLKSSLALHRLQTLRYFDPHHSLFVNDHSVGTVLRLQPLTLMSDAMSQSLHTLFSDPMFEQMDLQCVLMASPDIAPSLSNTLKQRDPVSSALARQRAEFLMQGRYRSLFNGHTLLVREYRVYLLLSLATARVFSNISEQSDRLRQARAHVSTVFLTHGIKVTLPDLDQLLPVLRRWAAPCQSEAALNAPYQPLTPLSEQLVGNDTTLSYANGRLSVQCDQTYLMITALMACHYPCQLGPQSALDWIGRWHGPIEQLPCPFMLSFHFHIGGPPSEEGMLSKMNHPDKARWAHSQLAQIEANIQKKYYDDAFMQQYYQTGGKQVQSFFQVILWSHPSQAPSDAGVCQRWLRQSGITFKKMDDLQLVHYVASQAFNFSEGLHQDFVRLRWYKRLTLYNAIHLLPLQAERASSHRPTFALISPHGQLTYFDPFSTTVGNYNIALSAQSGAGKSVFMQALIAAQIGQGTQVFVIDNGRSYERLVELYGGQCLRFDRRKPAAFNLFKALDEQDPFFEDALQSVIHLIQVMAKPQGRLNEVHAGLLARIVRRVWEALGQKATLSDLSDALIAENTPMSLAVSDMIFPYAKGVHRVYFQGAEPNPFDATITVIDLEDLMQAGDLMHVILCAYMGVIQLHLYRQKRDRPKMVVIDEAWKLLGSDAPMAAKFIETGYRTARKYSCSFVTITQSIEDFYKSASTRAALDSTHYQLFMSQRLRSNACDGLTSNEVNLISQLKSCPDYSELLLKCDQGLQVMRLVLDPFSKALFTTTGFEYEQIEAFRREGLSLFDAVCALSRKMDRK